MEDGKIEMDSIEPIGLPDITPGLARGSGFLSVLDLLEGCKTRPGSKYLFDSLPLRAAARDGTA